MIQSLKSIKIILLFVKKPYKDTKNVTFKITIWSHNLASNIKIKYKKEHIILKLYVFNHPAARLKPFLFVLVHHYHTHHTIEIKVTILLCAQAKFSVSKKNVFQLIRRHTRLFDDLRHVNMIKRHIRL